MWLIFYNILLIIIICLDEFVKKCKILSDDNDFTKINNHKIVDETIQPTICIKNIIKKVLKKNKITIPFKSSKLKLK